MAITENTFTADEIKAAIESNPSLVTVLKSLNPGGSIFVYEKSELDKFVTTEKQKAIDDTTSTIYSKIDQDILKLTGVPKGNEKTYDFLKRVLKEQIDEKDRLKTEAENLGEQIKKGGDSTLKSQYEALELAHKKVLEDTIPKLNQKLFEVQVGSIIESGTKEIQFNPAYDKSVIDTLVEVAKKKMFSTAKADGDKIIFLGEDGKPILNGIEVASPKDVFLRYIPATAIDSGVQRQGGGTGPAGTKTNHKNAEGVDIIVPSDIKNKVSLHEFLSKQGLASTSKEFIEIDAQYKDLPTV